MLYHSDNFILLLFGFLLFFTFLVESITSLRSLLQSHSLNDRSPEHISYFNNFIFIVITDLLANASILNE